MRSLGCRRLRIKLDFSSAADLDEDPSTADSPPEDFIGWYIFDTEDHECFEVTHFEEDDSETDQGVIGYGGTRRTTGSASFGADTVAPPEDVNQTPASC